MPHQFSATRNPDPGSQPEVLVGMSLDMYTMFYRLTNHTAFWGWVVRTYPDEDVREDMTRGPVASEWWNQAFALFRSSTLPHLNGMPEVTSNDLERAIVGVLTTQRRWEGRENHTIPTTQIISGT